MAITDMTQRSGSVGIVLGFFALLNGIGCSPFDRAVDTMDRMGQIEAEYGTMGISSPVLAAPSEEFAFNLNADASKFFTDAQTSLQGSASEFQQSILSAGAGLSASFNPAAGAAFLSQLQQYNQAVGNNNSAQSLTNLKNSIQNGAAYTQYQADVTAANALTDPAVKAAAIATAQQKLASSLTGPTATTLPAFPTASPPALPTSNLVSRPTDLIQQLANNGNFAGFQGLRPTPPTLGITDRAALLTAAGDNATSAIFKVLGNPALAGEFKDKRIMFGVCTVSVQPGWRTKKGYAADVSTLATYKYVPARPSVVDQYLNDPKIPAELRTSLKTHGHIQVENIDSFLITNKKKLNKPLYGNGPHVAVISPLTDTQTLDLQSSNRKEQDIALSLNIAGILASAGAQFQAQSFLNYVKSLQQDVATVSPDVVVHSYSTGSIFGFQVGPRLRAVEEVKAGKFSGAAQILDRQSFPALVIFGIEHEAYFPQVYWNPKTSQYELYEPTLILESVNRWVVAENSSKSSATPALGERDLLNLSKEINERLLVAGIPENETSGDTSVGLSALNDAPAADSSAAAAENIPKRTLALMKLRTENLKTQLFGGASNTYLPAESLRLGATAGATAVLPKTVQGGQTVTVAVVGHDLGDVELNKISLVTGDVDTNSSVAMPPFSAKLANSGVLLLTFTPNMTAVPPGGVQIQDNIRQAEANLEAALKNTQLPSQAIASGQTSLNHALGELTNIKEFKDDSAKDRDASLQLLVTLGDAYVIELSMQAAWNKIKPGPWDASQLPQLGYYVSSVTAIAGGLPQNLQLDIAAVKSSFEKFAMVPPLPGATALEKGAGMQLDTDIATLNKDFGDAVGTSLKMAQKALDGVKTALENAKKTDPPLSESKLQAVKLADAQRASLQTTLDGAKVPTIGQDVLNLQTPIVSAFLALNRRTQSLHSEDLSVMQAVALAKQNLATALGFYQQVQKQVDDAAKKAAAKPAAGSTSAPDPSAAALSDLLAKAQANVATAQAALDEVIVMREQTIVFALPSKTDSTAVANTPPIAVRGGDPSDLVVAPQSIQLSAPAAAGGTGSATAGSAGASGTPAPTGTTATVIIAGNNLSKVDALNITMVPASVQPLKARVVGNSIAIDISVNTPDTIYFQLPLVDSTRRITTPPIAVKPAPSASGASSAAIPTVTGISPSAVTIPAGGGPAVVYILGTNLDQVDLTALTVPEGAATLDLTPANKPVLSGNSIKVSLNVSYPSAPIVIGLPIKGGKGQSVNSFPLIVNTQPPR